MAHFKNTSALAALLMALSHAAAQPTLTLEPVTIKASAAATPLPSALISIGDAPLTDTPVSAAVITSQQIERAGAKRLADLNKLDSSVSDAYNPVGYWDSASVRGFVIDNKANYRRDGLPISGETAIALENKASVEVLKGISGLQAGVSSPGGLINYVVKRPAVNDFRTVRLEANSNGSVGAALDIGARFGDTKQFGYRINAAADKLDNYPTASQGKRQLFAVAGDWRVNADTRVQAELEYSHRSQPSVPGLSVLGNVLPAPNARLNLNTQPWTQPVVMNGLTGSLKIDQSLNADWRWSAHLGSQSLTTHDRLAYPFGCGKEGNYDRYCSDGTFDVYDYRSDKERRRVTAAQAQLKGQFETGSLKHNVTLSLLQSRSSDRYQTQAYNYSGEGSIYNPAALPADVSLTFAPTNRDERSLELAASDVIAWNSAFTTWAGVRFTQQRRASIATDGTAATSYRANVAAPWVAASYKPTPSTMAYASYGQGIELEVTPNRPEFTNAGQALPTLKSQQFELGVKGQWTSTQWHAAVFDITRPQFGNAGVAGNPCDPYTANTCRRQADGSARHRGLELSAATPAASSAKPWHIDGGITVFQAQRQGSTLTPALNGLHPTNVPRWVARLNAEYAVKALPGLTVQAKLSHEARRAVLADNSLTLPAWTRIDAGLRYTAARATWTLGIDNVLNKKHFTESPTQYGHVYLFTGAPRTVRLAVSAAN